MNNFLQDPEFMKLSPEAKKAVMMKLDQNFAALSPEAQDVVVTKISSSVPTLPSPQEQRESTARKMWNTITPMVSEGGPAAVGSMIGGALGAGAGGIGAVPGAAIGGALAEGGRQAFRRAFGPQELGPQSLPAAYTEQAMAGIGGLLSPEAVAAKYPLAAQGGKYGSVIPDKMKYAEAKNIRETGPISNVLKEAEFSQQRAAAAQAMREQKAASQLEFNKRVNDNLEPLRQEKNLIMNERGQRSAELARERTYVTETLREDLRGLKESTDLSKTKVKQDVTDEASAFAKSVGREMTRTEIKDGTLQARVLGQEAYTSQVRKLYKELDDDIFPRNAVEVPTGEMIDSGLKDAAGKPIMKPDTRLVSGGIDRSALKEKLKPLAEQYRAELTAARQNGSPGASAILQIVDGPAVVPGRSALDDLAALNNFGYRKADAGLKTQAEAITRRVADEYRKTIYDAIGKMKDGDKGVANLEKARALLAERDRIYRTGVGIESNRPIAKRAITAIEDTGNVGALVNDPIKLKTVLAQVDDETAGGIKNQISRLSLGKNPSDFAKNWSKLDPEVKAQVFTKEQIANADLLAAKGPAAISEIVAKEINTNTQLIKNATAKIRQIGDERMRLAQNPVEVRNLEAKIRLEKDAARKEQMKQSLDIMRKAAETRKAIADQQAMYRQGYEIQMRQARNRIDEVQSAVKKLKIGAGIVGAGVVTNWTFDKVAPLLGWTP